MSTMRHDSGISGATAAKRTKLPRGWHLLGLALVLILSGLAVHPRAIHATTSSQTFPYTGALQTFTVPTGVTSVTIKAIGAVGGAAAAVGRGASIQGGFTVNPGDQLTVLVGGHGQGSFNTVVGGGGGGSFVWTGTGAASTSNLLVAAGGGGGAGDFCNGVDASATSISGSDGTGGSPGAGGANGAGGGGGSAGCLGGGGGGGGVTGNGGTGATGSGGGSGGYSGGGGSYNGGANPTNTAGAGTGNGQVVVSWTLPDTTPPVVTVSFPTAPSSGWFTSSPVSGTVTADDTTTGDSNITTITCTGATVGAITGLGTPSASAPLSVATEGTTSVSCTATDSANNTGAAPGSSNTATIKIDSAAPRLKPTLSPAFPCPPPLSGQCVAQGAAVTASAGATDATFGVKTQSCGTVDTGSAGPHSVSCTATDNAGNSANAMLNYTVIQVITGTTSGSLTVAAGQTMLISGGTIGGSLTVQAGGALAVQHATIKGSLAATGAAALTVCGSTIQGATSVSASTGFVLLGDGGDDGTPACAGNTLSSLSLSGNTGGLELGGNQVSGSVSVAGNSGSGPGAEDTGKGPEIEANTITGSLSCSSNSPAPTNDGHTNTVSGKRSGQCAMPSNF